MRKSFLIRISPELWEELNRWAGEELRSVNGQIEFLLRQAVEQRRKKKLGDGDKEEGHPEEHDKEENDIPDGA